MERVLPARPAGFNPDQLVARGVFDSLAELDAVMCEWEEFRAEPRVLSVSWREAMTFQCGVRNAECGIGGNDFNRARVRSGVDAMGGSNAIPFEAAPGSSMRAPADVKQSALCIFCAWERAMQPGPRMARPRINGDVVLWPCERHAATAERAAQSSAGGNGQLQPHTPAA